LAVLKLYIILRLPRREKRVYSRCYASPLRTQNPPSPRGWNLWLGKFNKSASNTVPRFPQRYSSPAILSIVTRDILRAFVSRVNSQRMNDHFSFFRVFFLAYVCTMRKVLYDAFGIYLVFNCSSDISRECLYGILPISSSRH